MCVCERERENIVGKTSLDEPKNVWGIVQEPKDKSSELSIIT